MNLRGQWSPSAAVAFLLMLSLHAHASRQIEPGLESAVRWKWAVIPAPSSQWGLPVRELPVTQTRTGSSTTPHQNIHIVRKGDVLVHIARRHKLTVAQLKEVNNLEGDFLRIGQEIRIPDATERLALRSTPKSTASPAAPTTGPFDSEVYLLRVFLDAQGYSAGPISNTPDAIFGRILHHYQTAAAQRLDHQEIVSMARQTVRTPAIQYELQPADFRFIAPPKATPAKGPAPLPSYSDMVQSAMLAYHSPWEFVAERFGTDEAFLRKINPSLPAYPPAGSRFLVPNVTPFEIENLPALKQATPSPTAPVSARINGLSVLEIQRGGKTVAAMPLSRVRPGLRGSGEWQILDVIPRPALSTLREPRVRKVEQRSPFYTNPNPTPQVAKPTLSREEILPPGPNNPIGVAWINLAKDNSSPLPFGLHGSSIPSTVKEIESIGGFRLSNRDIVRAAGLLPRGTPLTWSP